MSNCYCSKFFVKLQTLILAFFLSQDVFAQTIQENTSARQLLQRWVTSAKRLNTLQAKAMVVFSEPGEQQEVHQYFECTLDLRQEKYHLIQSDSPKMVRSQSVYYNERIVDATSYVSSFLGSERKVSMNGMDDFVHAQWSIYFAQTHFAAPLNFFALSAIPQPIYTFVETLPLDMKEEERDVIKYAVLSAKSQGCHFEIWLDPQHDFSVKRFLFRAEKDNEIARGVKAYSYEVVEYSSKEELYFPRKIMVETSEHERELMAGVPGNMKMIKLPARTTKKEVSFFDIKINPKLTESSFRFREAIPDYTEVTVLNKRQIQHVWLDGKVVPLTDELMLAIARGGHKFMPGPDEPRFWLMSIGILLCVLGLGKMLYDHIKKTRGEA